MRKKHKWRKEDEAHSVCINCGCWRDKIGAEMQYTHGKVTFFAPPCEAIKPKEIGESEVNANPSV